jgi:hypothetical protein
MNKIEKLSNTELIRKTLDIYIRASLDDPVALKMLKLCYQECNLRGIDYSVIVQYGNLLVDTINKSRSELLQFIID